MQSPYKEDFDKQVIDSAFKNIVESKTKHLNTHFVFAGDYYSIRDEELKSFILKGMKKYKIKKIMVTKMVRWRRYLITQENMVRYCEGEEYQKESVNDDLDLLFEGIRLGKKPNDCVETYFLPILTKKELELVERKNYNYLKSFMGSIPDVDETEMELSESNSKFVYAFGQRRTFAIIYPYTSYRERAAPPVSRFPPFLFGNLPGSIHQSKARTKNGSLRNPIF